MNRSEECIVMLKTLLECAVSGKEVDNYELIFKGTLVTDCTIESFRFVLNEAIDLLEENVKFKAVQRDTPSAEFQIQGLHESEED